MINRLLPLALTLALLMPVQNAKAGVTVSQRAEFTAACQHYANRARFKPRTGDVAFVARLADACGTAFSSLDSANDHDHHMAIGFLSRLVMLRATITEINMERVFGSTYNAYSRPKDARETRTGSLGTVSETGEYLIAHRLGLVSAYRAWLDTEAAIAFASRQGAVQ